MESNQVEAEKEKLKDADEFMILDYIRSSIEILMNLKIEEYEEEFEEKMKKWIKEMKKSEKEVENSDEDDAPNNYEKLIQKLEADVWNHISVEQQLKLYVESYQQKLEEEENLNDQYEKDISKLKDLLKDKSTEIWVMKGMIDAKDKELSDLKS